MELSELTKEVLDYLKTKSLTITDVLQVAYLLIASVAEWSYKLDHRNDDVVTEDKTQTGKDIEELSKLN